MREKILVIDDEDAVCEILKYNLEKEGYDVETAYSAEDALNKDLPGFQLLIVDIMMGGISGFDLAKRIRNIASTERLPIIFCSALNEEDEKVMGLNIGADDYITKPFSIHEVTARVRAVLRRIQNDSMPTNVVFNPTSLPDITYKTLRLDQNNKTASIDGDQLQLTRTEYELLQFLLSNRNRIFSRAEIFSSVWGDDIVVTTRTIDTNITRLRKKLNQYSNCIITRSGFGYGFKEAY